MIKPRHDNVVLEKLPNEKKIGSIILTSEKKAGNVATVIAVGEGKLDEKTGEIVWEFDLPGSATKSFTLAYDVAWPKDKELSL